LDGDRGGVLDLKKLLQIAEIDFIARAPPGLEVEELTKKQILAALNKRIPVAQTKQASEELDLGEKYWEGSKEDLFNELDIEVHEKKSESFERPSNNYARSHHNDYNEYRPSPRPEFVISIKPQAPLVLETSKAETSEPRLPESFQRPKEFERPSFQKPFARPREREDPFKAYPLDIKKNMDELKNTFSARFFDTQGKLIEEAKVRDILKQVKDQKNASYLLFDGVITKRLVELSKSRGILAVIGSRKGKMDKVKGIDVYEYDA